MNEYLQEIENGKEILRKHKINLTNFKKILATVVEGTESLDEDEWVEHYNIYAGSAGRTGYEPLTEWAKEFYQDFKKGEHDIWLK